jgi:ferredoxin-thioredoxin reductase catalytic subunit
MKIKTTTTKTHTTQNQTQTQMEMLKLKDHIKLNLSRKCEQQATPCRRGAGTEDSVKEILCP